MTREQERKWRSAFWRAFFGGAWCILLLEFLRVAFGIVMRNPYQIGGVLTAWCVPGFWLYDKARATIQWPRGKGMV